MSDWNEARERQLHARWHWRHRWDDLARYNAGHYDLAPEPWYVALMAEQQAAFDREQAAEYARLIEADSPLGHGTPVPEEAELPSGDARIEAL